MGEIIQCLVPFPPHIPHTIIEPHAKRESEKKPKAPHCSAWASGIFSLHWVNVFSKGLFQDTKPYLKLEQISIKMGPPKKFITSEKFRTLELKKEQIPKVLSFDHWVNPLKGSIIAKAPQEKQVWPSRCLFFASCGFQSPFDDCCISQDQSVTQSFICFVFDLTQSFV